LAQDTPIYMDCHATTPVDDRVLQAMLPYLTRAFGNASSRTHRFGWEAEAAVEAARDQVARLLGAKAREIVFTSGATESCNLAIRGLLTGADARRRHIVTQQTEHHAVLDTCARLEREGCRLTVLPVDRAGRVDPDRVCDAICEDTALVSVMAAGNEIGTLQPIAEVGRICRERGVAFHTDATQMVGKLPLDVAASHIDLLSLSAHKIYGPKGAGALFVRDGLAAALSPLQEGGGQERGMRPGTLNVPGLVGLGAACEVAGMEQRAEADRVGGLRDRLQRQLMEAVPDLHLNGPTDGRLPGNLNVSFEGVDGESLMMGVEDVALSSGSACTSAALESSYVLRAIGLSDQRARCSIRFGLGRFNTQEEVDYVSDRLAAEVRRLRDLSPGYGKRSRKAGRTATRR
jgi:cysteine desulfurase